MDRATLKSMAKQQIKGNILTLLLITILIALISGAVSVIPVVGALVCTAGFSLSTSACP